jgi:hypothetical protein
MGVNKSRRPILAPQGTESVIPGVDTDRFQDLTDGPGDLSSSGDKIVKVNAGGTALEYDDAASSATNYSATETATGELWIDAAVVYRKVVAIATGPNNEQLSTPHGITGIATMISMTGTIVASGVVRPLPNSDNTAIGESIEMASDATNVYLTTTANYSTYAGHFVLIYTKS